jgi:hypothetical protein
MYIKWTTLLNLTKWLVHARYSSVNNRDSVRIRHAKLPQGTLSKQTLCPTQKAVSRHFYTYKLTHIELYTAKDHSTHRSPRPENLKLTIRIRNKKCIEFTYYILRNKIHLAWCRGKNYWNRGENHGQTYYVDIQ